MATTVDHPADIIGLRRAQRRPCEYLTEHITDRRLAPRTDTPRKGHDRPTSMPWMRCPTSNSPTRWRHCQCNSGWLFTIAISQDSRCREIAEKMACCEGTVMSRLHRGRQRLRTPVANQLLRREHQIIQLKGHFPHCDTR